ncbi:MFS transporter [Planosporangium thailandense]|uniref:MFS transporter n=1 Tax=Planosporangium thailandense TaxID=765197 RepID=UPI00197BB206|nr:MFS transporter [Planosporangium thailandense]
MSVARTLARTALVAALATRRLGRTGVRTARFVARNVLVARQRGGAGEAGMIRLLDLHAASCAGDTLVAIGLAGTVFFSVPVGEARGRVALYLLITMLPFALLAPVVGPVLDRFRHGRRYALALTMLGRAFLAYMIAEHIGGYTLYPAAFGMLVLSRAYGVARSAAVPRVLPAGLGLSEAGARASVFGTVAGAVVAPLGAAAALIGPAWPLRLSMIVFAYGMVVALRLPPRADSQPPEAVPRVLQLRGHKGAKVLSGRLVLASLAGSATLRAAYGFLTLFLAFAIRAHDLPVALFGWRPPATTAMALVAGALGLGSFLATAVGTTLRIRRPVLLQAGSVFAVTVAGVVAVVGYNLLAVAALCLVTAVASGLAKLSVDAVIQERVPERVRASAFAHSETLLMFAWVAGGALGLIPSAGRLALGVLATLLALGLVRAVLAAARLRGERLNGSPAAEEPAAEEPSAAEATTADLRRPGDAATRGLRGSAAERTVRVDPTAPGRPWPEPSPDAGPTRVLTRPEPDPPAGYHLYRPSGTDPALDPEDDA